MGFWFVTAAVIALPVWAMLAYNRLVRDLAVARAFGFGPGEFYQAESEQRPAVPVRIS